MILNYLRKNPNAGDTLEGMSKWLLDFEKFDIKVDEVLEILETLMREGKVERQVIDGGNPVYRICNRTN